MCNVWCREMFGDSQMKCQDPLLREQERRLRMDILHDSIGDDWILEPWLSLGAKASVPGTGSAGLFEVGRCRQASKDVF
jgi:hypothetical protein